MYTIIGGDGNEYGPVTADQLRHWANEGRVDTQSRVKREGSDDWTTLGELPELSMPPPVWTAGKQPRRIGNHGLHLSGHPLHQFAVRFYDYDTDLHRDGSIPRQ